MSSITSNGSAGKWIRKGEIWKEAGVLYFTNRYLDPLYASIVPPGVWNSWVDHPCPDLSPTENGGRIRRVQTPGMSGRGGGAGPKVNAFHEDDVDTIIRRRSNLKDRNTDPAGYGEWLDDNLFQLTRDAPDRWLAKGDVLCRDKKLIADADGAAARPPECRAEPQNALEPAVNGGRLRWLEVPKPGRRGAGKANVIVSSRSDWKKIIAARARHQSEVVRTTRGESALKLGERYGATPDDKRRWIDFATVLRVFRGEMPTASWKVICKRQNRDFKDWRYDSAAFHQWLKGRTIQAVVLEARRHESPRSKRVREKRLRRAVAFLQFVLSRGYWRPRQFSRFFAYPPAGQILEPCEGVPASDVHRWAKEAGVPEAYLWAAKKLLPPIQLVRQGQPQGHGRWRLTEPVVIPAAAPAESNGHAPNPAANGVNNPAARPIGDPSSKYPGHAMKRQRTGNPRDPEVAKVLEFCYDEYIIGRWSRKRTLIVATNQFKDDGPKTVLDVASNAKRWSRRFDPPLPMDRDGQGVAKLRTAMSARPLVSPEK